jgi:hypothetical protein
MSDDDNNNSNDDEVVNKTYLTTFRKYIETRCPSLTVKEASKATGHWVDVIGSEEKNDGQFTEDEKDAVYELGLVCFRPTIGNCISVTVEQRERLLQKWGLIKEEKKGKKDTPSTLTLEQLSDESARGYIHTNERVNYLDE